MEGDKDTVLELLIAINDYFLPKPNMKTPKKFNANNHNHNNYDIDYKMESNGVRNSFFFYKLLKKYVYFMLISW